MKNASAFYIAFQVLKVLLMNIPGLSQKIKTDDVFSKLGNQTSVYQRLLP